MSVSLDDYDDLTGDEWSPRFFSGLQSNSQTARKSQIANLVQSVRSWAERRSEDRQASDLLAYQLPTILRLRHECPLEDVRQGMAGLLDELVVWDEVVRALCAPTGHVIDFGFFLSLVFQAGGVSIPRILRSGPSSFFRKDEVCQSLAACASTS